MMKLGEDCIEEGKAEICTIGLRKYFATSLLRGRGSLEQKRGDEADGQHSNYHDLL